MRTPSVLRRKGVKEALQRFVEQVAKLPQVEAVLLVQGDEGWEIWTIVDDWDDAVVDAVIEQEGELVDEFLAQGQANLAPGFHIVTRQGHPLEDFLSPTVRILFRRG
ncbi:MAG: hypothetical protein ACK4I8_11595 [Armatimonadota bacterium]